LELRNGFRQIVRVRLHADGFGRAALVAHIDPRCGILAHQHDREPGSRFSRGNPRRDLRLDLFSRALGGRLAVDDAGTHEPSGKATNSTGFEASPSLSRSPTPPA